MTPNTSIVAFGRNSKHPVDLEEEELRDTHLGEYYEASYRPSRPPSKVGGGTQGTQTVQRTEVQQAPSRIEERNRDSFLRFRDEWVRNRARDIRQERSISFNTCSEDTASITALNEFYRWRVFEGFIPEDSDEKKVEIVMMKGSRDFGRFPKDVSVEKLHMCRSVCRENGRRAFLKTCRLRAKSRG
jgi:hypothetical protein